MEQDHILIQSIFEIYHTTKDKGDFIENIKLVYKWKYKQNLRELIKPMSDSLQMSQAEVLSNKNSFFSNFFLIKNQFFNFFFNKKSFFSIKVSFRDGLHRGRHA